MRICCVSDLHGHLPTIPDCDLLLIAGDILPLDAEKGLETLDWCRGTLKPWLDELFARRIWTLMTAGNHDLGLAQGREFAPGFFLPWDCLIDRTTIVAPPSCIPDGYYKKGQLVVHGTPWTENPFPDQGDWAFGVPSEEELAKVWRTLPLKTDILLSHMPPDFVRTSNYSNGVVLGGSPSLNAWIDEFQPKLVVCGHIHGGYGRYQRGDTIVVCASHVDLDYKPANPPILITEID